MSDHDGANAEAGSRFELLPKVLPGITAIAAVILSLLTGYFTPVTSSKQLTVVASLQQATDHTAEIQGRVFQDGDAVKQALVWAVAEYGRGQHDSPPATQTDDKGAFSIPLASTLNLCDEKNKLSEVAISVRKDVKAPWYWPLGGATLHGEDRVRPAGSPAQERVELSPLKLAPLLVVFLTSAMLPFFGQPKRWKHVFAVILAFLFTGLMILYLSNGLRYVNTVGTSQDVLSLGFATVYQSTYVEKVQPEWVFSFTAPPTTNSPNTTDSTPPEQKSVTAAKPGAPQGAAKPVSSTAAPNSDAGSGPVADTTAPTPAKAGVAVDKGFGAPLWVLLLSVLGAGVLTVALMVDEITLAGTISSMTPDQQATEIRKHLQTIVQHQVFILFAPVSGLFVYQTMVAGSAAMSSFTVALAALGAGPSLSALLTKAGAAATKLFS